MNPAMMYGMSGGGGATAGSASGGGAAGRSAPAPQGMDIGNLMMGEQMRLMKKQGDKIGEEARGLKRDNDFDELNSQKYGEQREAGYDQAIISGERANAQWEWEKASEYGLNIDGTSDEGKGYLNKTSPKYRQYIAGVVGDEMEAELKKETKELTKKEADRIYHEVINMYISSGSKVIGSIGGLVRQALGGGGKKGK